MGMHQTIYVGPYMTVPSSFDWHKWESFVCDGLMEARKREEPHTLIPNRKLEGIDRKTLFERDDEGGVVRIDYVRIPTEAGAFMEFIQPLIEHLRENGIEFSIGWGVVQGWS